MLYWLKFQDFEDLKVYVLINKGFFASPQEAIHYFSIHQFPELFSQQAILYTLVTIYPSQVILQSREQFQYLSSINPNTLHSLCNCLYSRTSFLAHACAHTQ